MSHECLFAAGFATRDQLKLRLRDGATVSSINDSVLDALLQMTSGAIEAAAGRPLRRHHRVHEYPSGAFGTWIQLGQRPVVAVHSVRESEVRDFETPGKYQELVEGVDWVFDTGRGNHVPGALPFLLRINGRWPREPGCIRVISTRGFKTLDEQAAEHVGVMLGTESHQGGVFGIELASGLYKWISPEDVDTSTEHVAIDKSMMAVRRGFLRFEMANRLPRSWRVRGGKLTFRAECTVGATDLRVYLLPTRIPRESLSDTYSLLDDPDAVLLGTLSLNVGTDDYEVSLSDEAATLLSERSMDHGQVAIGFRSDDETPGIVGIDIAGLPAEGGPRLTVYGAPAYASHRFPVPDDLIEANLLQAIEEYQHRRKPGMLQEFMRGVGPSTGASYLRAAAQLLPQVRMIAERYAE